MGENAQKQKYDGLDLIFRDAEHVERFIENSSANGLLKDFNMSLSKIDSISQGAI